MDEARQTSLDNDGPLVKFNSSSGKWCCMLCKRQFPAEKQLGQHLTASDLHKTNLAAAVASGRIIRSSGPPSAPPAHTNADDVRKRAREHDVEQSLPSQRSRLATPAGLHQMEEIERALQGRSGASSSGGGGGKEPLYRDRAKERRETQGSAPQSANATGMLSARDINNNLDWRCSHCNKLNFARELACISCTREVDEDTEYAIYSSRSSGRCTVHIVAYLNRYIDSSDYQKQRQRGMMKLAQRLEPGLLGGHRSDHHSDPDPHGERITRRV